MRTISQKIFACSLFLLSSSEILAEESTNNPDYKTYQESVKDERASQKRLGITFGSKATKEKADQFRANRTKKTLAKNSLEKAYKDQGLKKKSFFGLKNNLIGWDTKDYKRHLESIKKAETEGLKEGDKAFIEKLKADKSMLKDELIKRSQKMKNVASKLERVKAAQFKTDASEKLQKKLERNQREYNAAEKNILTAIDETKTGGTVLSKGGREARAERKQIKEIRKSTRENIRQIKNR